MKGNEGKRWDEKEGPFVTWFICQDGKIKGKQFHQFIDLNFPPLIRLMACIYETHFG
jgi:hypothetical protein